MRSSTVALAVVVSLALDACAVATGDGEGLGETGAKLIGGIAGTKTGLVVKIDGNGKGCTGVLYPYPGTTTARYLLTAHHCTSDEPYNSTAWTVTRQDGSTIGVEMIFPHPLAEWGLTGFDLGNGDTDGIGKVDMVLVRLASDVVVAAADAPVWLSTANTSVNVYHESRMDDGAQAFSWLSASISPHATWPVRAVTTGGIEGGDSGGPVWNRNSIDTGGRLLEGVVSNSGGGLTDSSSFYPFAVDGRDCGVFDITHPNAAFCTDACPCGVGEGDCDANSQCKPGLTCMANTGNRVGLPADYDVCLEPTRQGSNTGGYCESIGGCQLFEGDCNTHAGCKDNLVCRSNVGAAVGLNSSVDVCDLPRVPGWRISNRNADGTRKTEAANWCTTSSPCSLGDGDCDETNHATCRGYLKCKANVGNQFGFANNLVDVCVHPDYY